MDFAAVAHDLRAPLTAMLGHTQLLAVEGLSDTGRRRLQVMESQIRRMVTLIERCMPQLERSSRHAAPLDVTETIDDVVAELDAMCERRHIQVTVSRDTAVPFVMGDRDELHRLLVNLFINAAEAMPDGGRILVRVRLTTLRLVVDAVRPGEPPAGAGSSGRSRPDMTQSETDATPALEIGVTDTGRGISPDVVPRIFERGFTTKPPGQGTGLGLAICRDIVLAHGGTIDVRTGVGRGTTVQVCLPVTRSTSGDDAAHRGD
jgi:signal transduction histidine kinase